MLDTFEYRLEIHEIPLKSPPLDFGKLSISDASPIIGMFTLGFG